MPPGINTCITWSVLELRGLLEDEDSRVYFERAKRHVALYPFQLNDLNRAIREILDSDVNSYNANLQGLVLAYKNPKLSDSLGTILYDTYFIHVDIEADFYTFKPEIGCILKGSAIKKAINHIGVVVHKAFNVSIPKPEDCDEWLGNYVYVGQEVKFIVKHLDFGGKLPYIRGELVSDGICRSTHHDEDSEVSVSVAASHNGVVCESKKKRLKKSSGISTDPSDDEDAVPRIKNLKRKRAHSTVKEEDKAGKDSASDDDREDDEQTLVSEAVSYNEIECEPKTKRRKKVNVIESDLSEAENFAPVEKKIKRKRKVPMIKEEEEEEETRTDDVSDEQIPVHNGAIKIEPPSDIEDAMSGKKKSKKRNLEKRRRTADTLDDLREERKPTVISDAANHSGTDCKSKKKLSKESSVVEPESSELEDTSPREKTVKRKKKHSLVKDEGKTNGDAPQDDREDRKPTLISEAESHNGIESKSTRERSKESSTVEPEPSDVEDALPREKTVKRKKKHSVIKEEDGTNDEAPDDDPIDKKPTLISEAESHIGIDSKSTRKLSKESSAVEPEPSDVEDASLREKTAKRKKKHGAIKEEVNTNDVAPDDDSVDKKSTLISDAVELELKKKRAKKSSPVEPNLSEFEYAIPTEKSVKRKRKHSVIKEENKTRRDNASDDGSSFNNVTVKIEPASDIEDTKPSKKKPKKRNSGNNLLENINVKAEPPASDIEDFKSSRKCKVEPQETMVKVRNSPVKSSKERKRFSFDE